MTWLLLLLSGCFTGLLGAALGVGGGVVLVPILHLGFGLSLPVAVGTSLVVITGTSITASVGYLRRGLVDIELALSLELGALAGALVMSRIAHSFPERVVAVLFALLLAYTAFQLGRGRSQDVVTAQRSPVKSEASGRRLAAALSPVAGAASGLLGIGGGLIQVPIMRLLVGLDMLKAVATSTLMVGLTASIAAIAYLDRGEVDLAATPWLLGGILVGGSLAPAAASRLPLRVLELAFSVMLLWVAYKMAWR